MQVKFQFEDIFICDRGMEKKKEQQNGNGLGTEFWHRALSDRGPP
ncbi:MAG TPA: hypothetical protein VEG25_01730 [Burkholderiales bacterium]|nr:hypothetical protein [Burkholderiales bacterium]